MGDISGINSNTQQIQQKIIQNMNPLHEDRPLTGKTQKDISVVISLLNEKESLPELVSWIRTVMKDNGFSYEIIMIDDGSSDGSWELIKELATERNTNAHTGTKTAAAPDFGQTSTTGDRPASIPDSGQEAASGSGQETASGSGQEAGANDIRGISFRRNYGKSAALFWGFKAAEGRVVITMDADLQDSPDEIPGLYKMITEDGYDLVSGWKQHRQDNKLTKNIPSKIYNAAARWLTGIRLHDMNCGLKAYRNEVVKNIEVYGEMHRFIPYLAKNAGFTRIGEKPVHHQKRKYGKSKFGMSRFINGFLDLLSIWFLCTFGKNPMHFFGLTGILMFLAGGIIAVWLIISKVVHQLNGLDFRPVTDQPLFYLALVAVLMGVMLFLSGFTSELISRNSPSRNNYNIKARF